MKASSAKNYFNQQSYCKLKCLQRRVYGSCVVHCYIDITCKESLCILQLATERELCE